MTKKLTRYELWFWKWKHSGWWFRLFQSFQVVGYIISFFCIIPVAAFAIGFQLLQGLCITMWKTGEVCWSIMINPLQLWLSPDRPASWLTLLLYPGDRFVFREKETWNGRGFEKPDCEDDR